MVLRKIFVPGSRTRLIVPKQKPPAREAFLIYASQSLYGVQVMNRPAYKKRIARYEARCMLTNTKIIQAERGGMLVFYSADF